MSDFPRTAEQIAHDYSQRREGLLRALTSGEWPACWGAGAGMCGAVAWRGTAGRARSCARRCAVVSRQCGKHAAVRARRANHPPCNRGRGLLRSMRPGEGEPVPLRCARRPRTGSCLLGAQLPVLPCWGARAHCRRSHTHTTHPCTTPRRWRAHAHARGHLRTHSAQATPTAAGRSSCRRWRCPPSCQSPAWASTLRATAWTERIGSRSSPCTATRGSWPSPASTQVRARAHACADARGCVFRGFPAVLARRRRACCR
jgi:hypothetical protein